MKRILLVLTSSFSWACVVACGGGSPPAPSNPEPVASVAAPVTTTEPADAAVATASAVDAGSPAPVASAVADAGAEVAISAKESAVIEGELRACKWTPAPAGKTGMRVMGVKGGTVIAKRGVLQNGDQVENVNGIDLEAANASKILQSLTTSTDNPLRVTVRLVRTGKSVTTTYRVER